MPPAPRQGRCGLLPQGPQRRAPRGLAPPPGSARRSSLTGARLRAVTRGRVRRRQRTAVPGGEGRPPRVVSAGCLHVPAAPPPERCAEAADGSEDAGALGRSEAAATSPPSRPWELGPALARRAECSGVSRAPRMRQLYFLPFLARLRTRYHLSSRL